LRGALKIDEELTRAYPLQGVRTRIKTFLHYELLCTMIVRKYALKQAFNKDSFALQSSKESQFELMIQAKLYNTTKPILY